MGDPYDIRKIMTFAPGQLNLANPVYGPVERKEANKV